jgi:UMF1 family MFS transporter
MTTAAYGTRRERAAWCLFDFANSAFTTIAITAFGAPYFTGVLVGEAGVDLGFATLGPATAWGVTISVSMALVTLSSPIMGALADRAGKKRLLLAVYVLVGVAATFGLGFLPPGSGVLALVLYVIANFTFEGAYVFYNAFLPELAPPERIGRLSGWGWAFGYVGGLLALVLCLPFKPEDYTPEHAEAARAIFFIAGGWYLVFSLPALFFLRDRAPTAAPGSPLAGDAFRELARTFRSIRKYQVVAIFLAAYFLYNDAIVTVIEFVAVFTKEVLAFSPGENIYLFLVLNVVAAPGALFFGHLLDRVGGKRTIAATLLVWVLVVVGAALSSSRATFWPVAIVAAVVIGATQASSRALMARIAPRKRVGEFMGFLAFSGKASAVFGPALYGVVAEAAADGDPAGGHRVAIATIGLLFLVAFFIMLRVNEAEGMRRAAAENDEPKNGPS